ncbi:MAG: hypothetical protein R3320_04930, partial [Nitriliruptorales bacterium]|nr:hypothetical protein [Nitriliruptorales bacterium]
MGTSIAGEPVPEHAAERRLGVRWALVSIGTLVFVGALAVLAIAAAPTASTATIKWTGASSTAWSEAANWEDTSDDTNRTPTSTDDVYIPSGTPNEPTFTSNAASVSADTINTMTVESGATLTVSSGTLTVAAGSGSQDALIAGALDLSGGTLELSAGSGSDVEVTGTLTLDSGTVRGGSLSGAGSVGVGANTITLDAMTLNTSVDFTAAGGTLRVVNGLQLDATIELSG